MTRVSKYRRYQLPRALKISLLLPFSFHASLSFPADLRFSSRALTAILAIRLRSAAERLSFRAAAAFLAMAERLALDTRQNEAA